MRGRIALYATLENFRWFFIIPVKTFESTINNHIHTLKERYETCFISTIEEWNLARRLRVWYSKFEYIKEIYDWLWENTLFLVLKCIQFICEFNVVKLIDITHWQLKVSFRTLFTRLGKSFKMMNPFFVEKNMIQQNTILYY